MRKLYVSIRVITMFFIMMTLFSQITSGFVLAQASIVLSDDCVIPESGPWPPCATGGGVSTPPPSPDDCVIPASGAWPPCATGGGVSTPPPSADGCVIPASGAWPPCATGGGVSTPPPSADDCVIPVSGAWPPCATGSENPTPAPEPTPTIPEPQPEPTEPAPTESVSTHQYDLHQFRAILVDTWNVEGISDAGRIEDEPSIELKNGIVTLISSGNYKIELSHIFGASNGEITVDCNYMFIESHPIPPEDCAKVSILHGSRITRRIRSELGYREVVSFVADGNFATIEYR